MAKKEDPKAPKAKGERFVPIVNAPKPIVTIADAIVPGEKTVTMVFPKDVILNVGGGARALCKKGTREVPERLKDDWWLKANGAEIYSEPKAAPKPKGKGKGVKDETEGKAENEGGEAV